MVDENKKDEALQNANPENMDDKSINELLKEYAEDVKDRDLDEFLKDSPEDDAFEDDGDDVAPVVETKKKSSGFLTFLMFLIVCGAGGAAAWMYMNKDQGMTTVMGGFASDDASTAMNTPPVPDETPSMPAPTSDGSDRYMTEMDAPVDAVPAPADATVATDVPAPTPIVNETPADTTAPTLETAPSEPATDLLATATTPESTPAPAAEATPAPAPAADASSAVSDWANSAGDDMAATDAKLDAAPDASEPAVDVAEVNAKPVDKVAEPKTETKSADAPKKTARAASPYDDALAPPYVAIQAGKGGNTAPAQTETTSAAKMAPVVEGSASSSAEPTYKRGSTAGTEPAETRATGIYKDLVKQGGGSIDLPGLTANVKNDITIGQAQPAPRAAVNPAVSMPVDNGPTRLAIQGGKSLPPEMTVKTSATSSVTAKLPEALKEEAAEPVVPAVPVAPVQMETKSIPAKAAPAADTSDRYSTEMDAGKAPAAQAEESSSAPEPSGELRSAIQAALAAEKAGDKEKAIEMYQRALELDAVQASGRSLDRGMVYDRIGALRSGQ